jgi:hypothetical protein
MLGIEDPYVWLGYLVCILGTILCVVYGVINWNGGDEAVEAADVQWAAQEDKVEQELSAAGRSLAYSSAFVYSHMRCCQTCDKATGSRPA